MAQRDAQLNVLARAAERRCLPAAPSLQSSQLTVIRVTVDPPALAAISGCLLDSAAEDQRAYETCTINKFSLTAVVDLLNLVCRGSIKNNV
eukprot:SAG31_NODE_133_length_23315_cov_4.858847_9_plen_91_part_00